MRKTLTFVKNSLGQVSLVAAEPFRKDQIVFDLDMGEFQESPDLRTIELAPNLHVLHPWGAFTNHSCDPTCYVDKVSKVMRAKRDINAGEEISFNYLVNETSISSSFVCRCGSANCVGFVGSAGSKPTHLER